MYEHFDFNAGHAIAKVFFDPNKMIREDEEHLEEGRYNVLGKVGKILFVVCAF